MTTVLSITAFLDDLAPPQLAESWDNTGLLLGRRAAAVSRVLTCLTLTPDVAEEAVKQGVQLIVSHHPVLFRGAKQITDVDVEGRMLLTLIEGGISVYSPHTSYDSAAVGINQQLANGLGLNDVRPIRPSIEVEALGSGRMGQLSELLTLGVFLSRVRAAAGAAYLEFSGVREAMVSKVAVACGAAGEFLVDAIRLGCDTFVTGEARFHTALEARSAGVNLVLLGHYSSERLGVEYLADRLAEEFPDVTSFTSRVEHDPLSLFSDE